MSKFLTDLIYESFGGGIPPFRPITDHRCEECNEVDRLLGDRYWEEVESDFPDYCHDVFPLLTDAAKRYYLPAFLLTALMENSGGQCISMEMSLGGRDFTPGDFTEQQRSAICAWIQEYRAIFGDDEPIRSLYRIWFPSPE